MTNMNVSDWLAIVEYEEGEQLVAMLIEELIQRSQKVIFERHIESQVLPYAVKFAKDTLVEIIEVHALAACPLLHTRITFPVELFQARLWNRQP